MTLIIPAAKAQSVKMAQIEESQLCISLMKR